MVQQEALISWLVHLGRATAQLHPALLAIAAAPVLLAVMSRSLLAVLAALLFVASALVRFVHGEEPDTVGLAWLGAVLAALAGFRIAQGSRRATRAEAAVAKLRDEVNILLASRERSLIRSVDRQPRPVDVTPSSSSKSPGQET